MCRWYSLCWTVCNRGRRQRTWARHRWPGTESRHGRGSLPPRLATASSATLDRSAAWWTCPVRQTKHRYWWISNKTNEIKGWFPWCISIGSQNMCSDYDCWITSLAYSKLFNISLFLEFRLNLTLWTKMTSLLIKNQQQIFHRFLIRYPFLDKLHRYWQTSIGQMRFKEDFRGAQCTSLGLQMCSNYDCWNTFHWLI